MFDQGDINGMRERLALMICDKSCEMFEVPSDAQLIETRQNLCDSYHCLNKELNKTVNVSINVTNPQLQRNSISIPIENMNRLQEGLDNRYGEAEVVHCSMSECDGLQSINIHLQKMPTILVIEPTAAGDDMPLLCMGDIESNLTIKGFSYVLLQVILHNGGHYRGITIVNNQNVLYDGKCFNEFKSISATDPFASDLEENNYKVSCLWYRKGDKRANISLYSIPLLPRFEDALSNPTESMQICTEKTYEEATTCETATPSHPMKRIRKQKKIYTPDEDQMKPKQKPKLSKKKVKAKVNLQSPFKKQTQPKTKSTRYTDPVGLSMRKGRGFGPLPRCPECDNCIPENRWRVINRVKREGENNGKPFTGYDVYQIHIFCAKLKLSDKDYKSLVKWLMSSKDKEVSEKRAAWIQSMNQGMGKSTGSTRKSSIQYCMEFAPSK